MKRLVLCSFTAALATVGSILGVSPANAAPAATTCRPGVIIASSASVSPRIVHAGQMMTVDQTVQNCTARTQTVVVRMFTTLPKSCGTAVGAGVGHYVMWPYSGVGSASGGQAPTCLGRYVDVWQTSIHGKVVSRASASYTVIK